MSEELLEVIEEASNEKIDAVNKSEKTPIDPDFIEHGFTCERNKRLFVDDTEEQNVTKFPKVNRTGFGYLSVWDSVIVSRDPY